MTDAPTDTPMERALALARAARGTTSPNPPVGAVLVKAGRIVGEGRTQPPGGPHAEIEALRASGTEARGATLFVTLEPCSHWGRTPPCADALIEAGIAAAHVAVLDPNPVVQGEGVRRLRAAGIAVTVGERAEEAAGLIEAHARFTRDGRPLVTLVGEIPEDVLEELRQDADLVVDATAAAPTDPRVWLHDLAEREVTSVLVSSASPLGIALSRAGLVDRHVAPDI